LTKDFKGYIDEVKRNAKIVAEELIQLGYKLSTDGTDNHLLLIDLREKGITGSKAEYVLEQVSISVNKNTLKGDKSALSPGGIRIGLCAMTTRGLRYYECNEMVHLIHRAIEVGRKIDCIKLIHFKEKVNRFLNGDMDDEEKELGFELQQLKKDVYHYSCQFNFLNRL
jgi:glycine hydroxymethyltransferase